MYKQFYGLRDIPFSLAPDPKYLFRTESLLEVFANLQLRQLKQRVSLKCSIKTLTPHETGEYVRWRLRIAGCTNENLFEPEAIKMVHRFSGGKLKTLLITSAEQ